MAVRFAIWDLHLYLDTHMGDCTAMELVEDYKKKYEALPRFCKLLTNAFSYSSGSARYYNDLFIEIKHYLPPPLK